MMGGGTFLETQLECLDDEEWQKDPEKRYKRSLAFIVDSQSEHETQPGPPDETQPGPPDETQPGPPCRTCISSARALRYKLGTRAACNIHVDIGRV
jgi:hypothetical protein